MPEHRAITLFSGQPEMTQDMGAAPAAGQFSTRVEIDSPERRGTSLFSTRLEIGEPENRAIILFSVQTEMAQDGLKSKVQHLRQLRPR